MTHASPMERHHARSTFAFVMIAFILLGGVAADSPSGRFEQNMMVRLHMHDDHDALQRIQGWLVHGKLDAARELADALARAPDEPGMSAFTIQTTRVRASAAALAQATSIDEALREEPRLAAACGACHVAAGVQLELRSPAIPPDRPTIEARMARHVWATDRLWESLLADTIDPWRAGLDLLAAPSLPASELGDDRLVLAKQFQHLALDTRALLGPLDLTVRAAAFGELLVACAGCHALRPSDQASRLP